MDNKEKIARSVFAPSNERGIKFTQNDRIDKSFILSYYPSYDLLYNTYKEGNDESHNYYNTISANYLLKDIMNSIRINIFKIEDKLIEIGEEEKAKSLLFDYNEIKNEKKEFDLEKKTCKTRKDFNEYVNKLTLFRIQTSALLEYLTISENVL